LQRECQKDGKTAIGPASELCKLLLCKALREIMNFAKNFAEAYLYLGAGAAGVLLGTG